MSLTYKKGGRSILTRFRGRYVNNDDLQRILLEDAVKAAEDGELILSDYLRRLASNLDNLKE